MAFRCPSCRGSGDTTVFNSRPIVKAFVVWRRRDCPVCGHRFTTVEVPTNVENLAELRRVLMDVVGAGEGLPQLSDVARHALVAIADRTRLPIDYADGGWVPDKSSLVEALERLGDEAFRGLATERRRIVLADVEQALMAAGLMAAPEEEERKRGDIGQGVNLDDLEEGADAA